MAAHTLGFITASTVSPFLTGKGDTLLKGGVSASFDIALERLALDGHVEAPEPWAGNDATEWGNANESDAIKRYEEMTFSNVYDSQVGVKKGWTSCTPDGYVGQNGLVEIKCPFKSAVHMSYRLDIDEMLKKYADQVQFQMMLTGSKWCDLVSFDPRWDEPLDILIHRVEADHEWQKRTRNRLKQAEQIITETIGRLLG